MKKIIYSAAFLLLTTTATLAQNVGIGTTIPAAKLDVKSTSSYVAQFNGLAPMYMGIFEGDVYRGYWGSYAGAAEDVDFGTGAGTTGKLHLTIQATPRLTIDNTGKVGIGTTSPTHLLHVNGGDLFVQSSSGKIVFGYDGANQWQMATTGGGADLRWETTTDGGTNVAPKHYFSQNGDVGIGTGVPVPVARLDVKSSGATASTNAFMIKNSAGDTLMRIRDNGYVGIGYNGPSYGRPLNIQGSGANFYYDGATFGGAVFPNSGGNLVLWSQSASDNIVALQPSWGSVTIGTYTAATGYKLSVKGKAICEELKVQLSANWPDYVFDKAYSLLPLEELETSLEINKHLPNIPSAADITANKGFEVGDMNRRLLEKVEELTLYIIQINKEKKQLETRLSVVEKNQAQKN